MKRLLSIASLTLLFAIGATAQKLEVEKTYVPESLTKDSYIGNVSYDPSTEVTSLVYVEKDAFKTKFKTYMFDKDLNFMKEDIKVYTFGDAWRDAMAELRESFRWFKYKGESYTREWIDIRQAMFGGKIIAEKKRATWKYNWFFGGYIPHYDKTEQVKIKSETDDKIYLYDHVVNTETGDAYMIVGVKAPKGSKIKKQHARKFQIVKLTNDLEVEYLEEFEFPYNMCIAFEQIIYTPEEEPDEEFAMGDVAGGSKWYVFFAPVKGMSGKKDLNPKMGESMAIVMNDAGKIEGKMNYVAPTEGWLISGLVQSPDKKDFYIFGPAKDGVYIDQVAQVTSPVVMSNNDKDIKYKNYQIMKVSNGNVAWINSTPLEDFELKASTPPSQKKKPEYKGKNFNRRITFVTDDGELILAGQNYSKKVVKEGDNWKTVIVYKDLILCHFNDKGDLKRAYGVRRDKMNKWSKEIVTPMDMYITPNGKHLYWVYGEIKGMRQGFSFGGVLGAAGVGTVSKRKLLYYPAVAKVDLENATIGDFVYLGADAEGKQVYYTNPNAGQIMSADGKKLIFVGEDKKGKMLWLAKLAID